MALPSIGNRPAGSISDGAELFYEVFREFRDSICPRLDGVDQALGRSRLMGEVIQRVEGVPPRVVLCRSLGDRSGELLDLGSDPPIVIGRENEREPLRVVRLWRIGDGTHYQEPTNRVSAASCHTH
jgi:hypothetical protein